MTVPNTQFNLKTGGEVRLDGIQLLKVDSVNQPFLKACLSFQDLAGTGCFLYDNNIDDWVPAVNPVIVGLGDKLIIGDVQVLFTNFSKNQGIVRLSLRSDNPKTSQLLRASKCNEK